MSESIIRPLGNRVLVKPYPKRTESPSGLAIVEDFHPDTGGTVVAIGDGVESRQRAVHRFADRALDLFEAEASQAGCEEIYRAVEIVQRLRDDYQPEHVCQVGDEVTFGMGTGTELDINGETYILVNEDDLETLCEPIEATV